MGVVNTTYTFAGTDVITSAKMNNIIDETTFTGTAVFNSTLEVSSGKLKVGVQGITSNELASNAVKTVAIEDGAVTPAKLANSDFGDFTVTSGSAILDNNVVTTAKILDASVTTAKIADASITSTKLNGAQTGPAPIYGVRAWANFNGTVNNDLGGNYSRSGSNTVTITTATEHGLVVGHRIFIDFTLSTGTAPFDGIYEVATVTDVNTFTVLSSTTTASTGTVSLKRKTIRASGNVANISAGAESPIIPPTANDAVNNGLYIMNFAVQMPDSNFAISGSVSETGLLAAASGDETFAGAPVNAVCAYLTSIKTGTGYVSCVQNSVSILR